MEVLPRDRRPAQQAGPGLLAAVAGWLAASWIVFPWLRDLAAQALLAGSSPDVPSPEQIPAQVWAGSLVAALGMGWGILATWAAWQRARSLSPSPLATNRVWTDRRLGTVIGLATALIGISLLASGDPTLMDAKSHVARGWMWETALREGRLPHWTPLWYGGMPGDLHYPPLTHVLTGALGMLGGSPYEATKVVAWLAQIAGAVGFALWASRFYRSTLAGLMGGGLYALAPTLHASWIWEGRLPGIALLGLAPWLFFLTERILSGQTRRRDAGALAWILWLCVATHSGQARVAILLWGLYTLARAFWDRDRTSPRFRANLGWLGAGAILGVAAIAATLAPMFAEAHLLNDLIPRHATGLRFRIPDLGETLDLLRWNPRGSSYLGLSLIIAAGVAGIAMRSWAQRRLLAIPIGLFLFTVLFTGDLRRDLDFYFFGLILLAAGCGTIQPGTRRWLLVVALLLLDLAPLQWINTYSTHRQARATMYDQIEETLEAGRVLEIPAHRDGTPWPSHWYYAPTRPIRMVGGPFIQGAPTSFRFEAAIIDTTAHALAAWSAQTGSRAFSLESLPPNLIRLLAFHNIAKIVVVSPAGPVCPPLEIPDSSPVQRFLSPPIPGSGVGPVDPPDEIIVSRGLPPGVSRRVAIAQLRWIETLPTTPIRTIRYEYSGEVELWEIEDFGGGTIRLQRTPYPGTEVRVDGVVVPWSSGPWGGLQIAVDAGSHRIEAVTKPSRARTRWFWGRNAILALALVLLLPGRRRRRPNREFGSGQASGGKDPATSSSREST